MSKDKKLPYGVWPVALTPFKYSSAIDFDAYEELIEFYINAGCSGIFAVCLSSELFHLSASERLELARFTLSLVDGRLPVVCSAYIGDSLREKEQALADMLELEPDAVVILSNHLDPNNLAAEFLKITSEYPDANFGLYESPLPEKRLISVDELAECGNADNFIFLKDTCCDLESIIPKIEVLRKRPAAIYDANLKNFPFSVKHGGHGYCGTCANIIPELVVRMSELAATGDFNTEEFLDLYETLMIAQQFLSFSYPRSAKNFLSLRGLKISDVCRTQCKSYNNETFTYLKNFHSYVMRIIEKQKEKQGVLI